MNERDIEQAEKTYQKARAEYLQAREDYFKLCERAEKKEEMDQLAVERAKETLRSWNHRA